ncbi:MAG: hypothetical protein Q8N53_24045 [Longimicrobiales bacterium]|nr:hypothetical protein [Longimicrobiales bacterium]
MRRFILIAVLLSLAPRADAAGQVARCRLAPRPYGYGGLCMVEQQSADSLRMRLPFEDSVRVWATSGPRDPAPWRGNISLPRVETAFEIAPDGSGASPARFVFRTGLAWLPVLEWRELDSVAEGCSACERSARDVLLVLDLVKAPPATTDDVAILRTALASLDNLTQWNRNEVQNCTSSGPSNSGLFCLLYSAVESRMGRYHHRQPALELARLVIIERWRDRITSHPFVDMNNHPATTMADLRALLEQALDRATAEAQPPAPWEAILTPP